MAAVHIKHLSQTDTFTTHEVIFSSQGWLLKPTQEEVMSSTLLLNLVLIPQASNNTIDWKNNIFLDLPRV